MENPLERPHGGVRADASPERIGEYEVISEITRSTTGRVFTALDPKTKKLLAIKEMLLEPAEAMPVVEQVNRFKREAEIHMSLRHPHIVPCLDAGVDVDTQGRERHYLVMEYQAGHSWHSLLEDDNERKALTLPRILELGVQLCKALHYMHEHGVIHRDIKPANLLISPLGQLKVTDFGLAKQSFGPGITQAKMMLGTLNYMSPEQLLDPTGVDARSDIFSAGAILYKTLSGSLPFAGPNATDVAKNLLYMPPQEPRELNPHLPASLCEKLVKSLHKDPDYRYLSAEGLSRDLEAELANPAIYVAQGRVYMEQGLHREASQTFQQAVNLDADSPCAWFGLGECFDAMQQEEQALECYLRVIALDPSRVEAFQRLGRTYKHRGNPQAALKMFHRAWVLNPEDRDTCLMLGRTYLALKQTAEAIWHFQMMIERYPNWAEAHFELGRILYQERRHAEALAQFEKAAALQPINVEMLFNLASLQLELQQFGAAKDNLTVVIQLAPKHARSHHNLGLIHLKSRQQQEAEASFRRAVELDPTSAMTYYHLGYLYDQTGRSLLALEALRAAVQHDATNVDYLLALGHLYFRGYQIANAIEMLRRAAQLEGEHQAHTWLSLAEAHRITNGHTEALEAAQRCLRLSPPPEIARAAQDLIRQVDRTGKQTGRLMGTGSLDRLAR